MSLTVMAQKTSKVSPDTISPREPLQFISRSRDTHPAIFGDELISRQSLRMLRQIPRHCRDMARSCGISPGIAARRRDLAAVWADTPQYAETLPQSPLMSWRIPWMHGQHLGIRSRCLRICADASSSPHEMSGNRRRSADSSPMSGDLARTPADLCRHELIR